MTDSLLPIIEALRKPQKILVTSHTNPDGDAVGSSLALMLVLQAMGHKVTCYNPDPIPDLYLFLPEAKTWRQNLAPGEKFDATVVIDVADLERTGLAQVSKETLGSMYVLDHHLTQGLAGSLQYIDSAACAAGVLVYRLAKRAGITLTLDMAKNIYCCILTDTGSFRYSSANPEAFRVASELVELGVEPWEFASQIYENQPRNKLLLLIQVLKTLEFSADGRVAVISISQKLLDEFKAGPDLTDGFINYPRSIAGVEVAICLRETPEGSYKASMRSLGHVDVAEICRQFGGGGHRNAAGCTIEGERDQIKKRLLDLASQYCKNL